MRDRLLSLGRRDPVERLSETKARDPMRQMTSDLFATGWQHHGSSFRRPTQADLEVEKIIDPHGRGCQMSRRSWRSSRDTDGRVPRWAARWCRRRAR